MTDEITQQLLHSIYHYDPMTGELTYKVKTNASVWVGKQVGGLSEQGYIRCSIYGTKYMVHRLIWLHVYGKWPEERIDHINGVRHDNRLCNLREASMRENSRNMKVRSTSFTGIKGLACNIKPNGSTQYTAHVTTAKGKRSTKSLTVGSGGTEEEIVEELTKWLHDKRKEYHGDFSKD